MNIARLGKTMRPVLAIALSIMLCLAAFGIAWADSPSKSREGKKDDALAELIANSDDDLSQLLGEEDVDVEALLSGNPASAIPSEADESAGNVFGSSESTSAAPVDGSTVARDLCWVGKDLSFADMKVGGDFLAAGMNISLGKSKVGGSVRIAGMNIGVDNVMSDSNFTLAGQNIKVKGSEALGGVYCAGSDISFDGTAMAAVLIGKDLEFNGAVNGDVAIIGDAVSIGKDAVIGGTLTVTSGTEPEIASSAKIGDYNYIHQETTSASDVAESAASAFVALAIAFKVIGVLGAIVFAIVLAWLFRRPVEGAAAMTRTKAGRIFATGAITAFAAPIAFVLLLCFVVTSPIAFALLFMLLALTVASVPFAAASLSRLVFPNMNRIGAAAIGGVVLGISSIIPLLGGIVSLAAFMYITGYAIQALWTARHNDQEAPSGAPVAVPAVAPSGAAVSYMPEIPTDAAIDGGYVSPSGEEPTAEALVVTETVVDEGGSRAE